MALSDTKLPKNDEILVSRKRFMVVLLVTRHLDRNTQLRMNLLSRAIYNDVVPRAMPSLRVNHYRKRVQDMLLALPQEYELTPAQIFHW